MEREGGEGSSKGWSCETNWTVAKGSSSLDASISFDTSDEDAPDLTSDGTLLLRPSASDDSPPCEVTVFFKGKYEIHRVYARTSARIFEIYYTKDADRNSTKEYLCTVKCGPASSDENLHGSSQNSSVHSSEEESWVDVKTPQIHYEATAEITDAEPCASLTLRFLSLQTKSSVHVEEIYIYSDPIDESSTSTTQDSSSGTTGNSNASSLFAMLVPNLLQMSKSGLSSRINERYFSHDRIQNTDDVRDQNAKLDTSVTEEPSTEAVYHTEENNPVATDTTLPSLVQSQNSTSLYQTHAGSSSKANIRQVNQEAAVNTDPLKVGPTSNESANRIEKILEQLVFKVDKIETYITKFEEKMVGPIICIESRLERLENQFDLLTKDLHSMRVPPREPCPRATDEIEKSQDPVVSPDDDSMADGVAGCQVETKTCTGTTFKAPECMSEDESDDDVRDDDMEDDTCVPNKRKPISIDGALASALAAFATESSPNISTVTSDKINDPDLVKGVPLVSIDEVDSDLLSTFEAVTHTDQNYNAKDITCAEGSREDSDVDSQIKPGLFSKSIIGEVSDEEEEVETGFAPDNPLSSFEAVTVTHADRNYNAKDITCAVGPTEGSREDSHIDLQIKPGLFSKSIIGEVSDEEEEVETGFAPDALSSFEAVTVTHADRNYNAKDITCAVGPTEGSREDFHNLQIKPGLFSKSIIGEVSDEEEEVETGFAPDALSSFEAVTHADRNYNAKDITCAVGPTEGSREDFHNLQIKPGLFSKSIIGEVSDEEEEAETGFAPDPLSSFEAVTVTHADRNYNEVGRGEEETTNLDDENLYRVDERDIVSEVGPSLFSKSVIGEVSDEEEEVETGYGPDSSRFTCNSPLSSSDFEPNLPNYSEILNGWGNDSSSSTDSSFDESFLKTKINTDFVGTFNEGVEKVSVIWDEVKMRDPLAVLLDEMTALKEEENNTSVTNDDPFIDFENFSNPSEVGPTYSNMPQFESLI